MRLYVKHKITLLGKLSSGGVLVYAIVEEAHQKNGDVVAGLLRSHAQLMPKNAGPSRLRGPFRWWRVLDSNQWPHACKIRVDIDRLLHPCAITVFTWPYLSMYVRRNRGIDNRERMRHAQIMPLDQ